MAPIHYLNQCWVDINWSIGNEFQLNFIRNSTKFFQENSYENVVWKMSAILSLSQCVNGIWGHSNCNPTEFRVFMVIFLIYSNFTWRTTGKYVVNWFGIMHGKKWSPWLITWHRINRKSKLTIENSEYIFLFYAKNWLNLRRNAL